jgi:hypothetical protein
MYILTRVRKKVITVRYQCILDADGCMKHDRVIGSSEESLIDRSAVRLFGCCFVVFGGCLILVSLVTPYHFLYCFLKKSHSIYEESVL